MNLELPTFTDFDNLINDSLLPLERESYFNTLKILKLTNKDIYDFILDFIQNYVAIEDGTAVPLFNGFSRSMAITKLEPFIYSNQAKHKKALIDLEIYLRSILIIIESSLTKASNTSTVKQNLEGFKRKVDNRFSPLGNQVDKTIQFKGHHSFQLKKPLAINKKIKLLEQLKTEGFIAKTTTVDQISAIFSGKAVSQGLKISWFKLRNLYFFVKTLRPHLEHENDVYETATRCFTIKGAEILDSNRLVHSSGGKKNLSKIQEIISNLQLR